MAEITTVFSDIGGVILTNGWDRGSRREAANTFHLNWEEFQDRHDLTFPAFDAGQITLNEYLDRTLFYRQRPFSREEITAFMFAQSKEYPEARAILDQLAASKEYFMGAINNEPLLEEYLCVGMGDAKGNGPRFNHLLLHRIRDLVHVAIQKAQGFFFRPVVAQHVRCHSSAVGQLDRLRPLVHGAPVFVDRLVGGRLVG